MHTTSFETGLDLRFLKDRASLSFTYYNKNTKNQILTSTINGVSGYGEALFNAGEVKNWGYEVTLGVVPFGSGFASQRYGLHDTDYRTKQRGTAHCER